MSYFAFIARFKCLYRYSLWKFLNFKLIRKTDTTCIFIKQLFDFKAKGPK